MCFSGRCYKENERGQCTNVYDHCVNDIRDFLVSEEIGSPNMSDKEAVDLFKELCEGCDK